MKFLKVILDFFFPWPTLGPRLPPELALKSTIDVLEKDKTISLEVANRIHDAEVHRRGTADTKAALYLAFLAAILPLIGVLKPQVMGWPQRWFEWIDTVLFIAAIIYLVAAAVFVMRSITSSVIHTIGEGDLYRGLVEGKPAAWIAHETLLATMYNYHANNRKITFVNFAQRHVFRAMLMLTALVTWGWLGALLHVSEKEPNKEIIPTICNEMDVLLFSGAVLGDPCPGFAIGVE